MAPVIPPRFAVVGTGGSGTAYVARVFRANGVRCGHEQWWTPFDGKRRSGLEGDSSWLAVPDIETGRWSGPVLHVTRHPLGVTRNLLAGIFSPQSSYPQFRRFALAHEPDLAPLEPLEGAVEWWIRWNRRCAAVADLTIQIDDLLNHLDVIGVLAGRHLDQRRAERVPTNVNHRDSPPIDEMEMWRLLGDRADQFGYAPEVTCG